MALSRPFCTSLQGCKKLLDRRDFIILEVAQLLCRWVLNFDHYCVDVPSFLSCLRELLCGELRVFVLWRWRSLLLRKDTTREASDQIQVQEGFPSRSALGYPWHSSPLLSHPNGCPSTRDQQTLALNSAQGVPIKPKAFLKSLPTMGSGTTLV